MMKNLSFILLAVTIFAFSSCDKKKNTVIEEPEVHEHELITTIELVVTNNAGFNKKFHYKVSNGFNSANPATPEIEPVVLDANTTYNVEVEVLNEEEEEPGHSHEHDVTHEIKEENKEHLFIFQSTPPSGAGSIAFSNGSKDDDGAPFNQMINFTTGATGSGQLTVTLKHEPTNKSATNPTDAGGETDAQAIFPVTIQ